LTKQGDWAEAKKRLTHSLRTAQEFNTSLNLPEVLGRLGELYEVGYNDWSSAESYYRQSLDLRWTNRLYFISAALTGLVRVKHAQGDYAAIPPLLAEAEQLSQQYEYNDHLASLRLTQGHIGWEGQTFEVSGNLEDLDAFDIALRYYQQALIYALRYNRFLLDEVLSGRPQGTPLWPIVPACLARGVEGRRMLAALRDWWQTGVNDIGAPRPDTISPIPEGIPLLEAERTAREREPGDGSRQKTVMEQLGAALT
jgi:tetratricopeptide (TPR) repeat protein